MGVEVLELAQALFEQAKAWVLANPRETIIAVQALVILRLYFRRPTAIKIEGRTVRHIKAYKLKTRKFKD